MIGVSRRFHVLTAKWILRVPRIFRRLSFRELGIANRRLADTITQAVPKRALRPASRHVVPGRLSAVFGVNLRFEHDNVKALENPHVFPCIYT